MVPMWLLAPIRRVNKDAQSAYMITAFKQSVRRRHTETETEMETDGNKQAAGGKIEPRRGEVQLLSEQALLTGAETNPGAAFITSSPVRAPPPPPRLDRGRQPQPLS